MRSIVSSTAAVPIEDATAPEDISAELDDVSLIGGAVFRLAANDDLDSAARIVFEAYADPQEPRFAGVGDLLDASRQLSDRGGLSSDRGHGFFGGLVKYPQAQEQAPHVVFRRDFAEKRVHDPREKRGESRVKLAGLVRHGPTPGKPALRASEPSNRVPNDGCGRIIAFSRAWCTRSGAAPNCRAVDLDRPLGGSYTGTMAELVLMLEADETASDGLQRALAEGAVGQVSTARKSHLDGSAQTVILIIQVAILAASSVPAILLPFLDRKRVRKFKCGDIEIENPTPEQVEQLWERCMKAQAEG